MGNHALGAVGRPRGRPQRLPQEASHSRSSRPDGAKRLAWLLATSRLMGPTTAGYSRKGFARVLHDSGISADPSRISRWESGVEHLPARLVRAYEQACGLGPHTLDLIRRMLERSGYLESRANGHGHPDPTDPARFDAIVDNMVDGQADGVTWLEFVDEIGRYDQVYLHRRTWTEITAHLVDELSRAQGFALLRRYEAATALLADPRSRTYLSKAIGRFALAPNAGRVQPVLSVLSEVGTPAASTLVLRLLASDNPRLRNAAAGVAAIMVGRGRLDAGAQDLEHYVGRALAQSNGETTASPETIANLVIHLDEASYERVVGAAAQPHLRQLMAQVRDQHELISGDQARTMTDRIAHRVETDLGRQAMDPDLMLRTLLRETLFHASRERRYLATAILRLSPFGPASAAAILDATAGDDESQARLAWMAIPTLADVVDAKQLFHRVVDESRPSLRPLAIRAAAGFRAPLPGDAVDYLVEVATQGAPGERGPAATALGLGGQQERLGAIAAATGDPTAQWWAERRPAIQE